MGVEISDIFVMLEPQVTLSPEQWLMIQVGLEERPEDKWTTLESPENLLEVIRAVEREMTGEGEISEEREQVLSRRAEGIFAEFDEQNLQFDQGPPRLRDRRAADAVRPREHLQLLAADRAAGAGAGRGRALGHRHQPLRRRTSTSSSRRATRSSPCSEPNPGRGRGGAADRRAADVRV